MTAAKTTMSIPGWHTVACTISPDVNGNCRMAGTASLPGVLKSLVNSGKARPASITGYCFNDKNGNKKWDKGERGELGIPVVLYGPQGDLLKGVYTNKYGYFSFTGLAPGQYKVEAGSFDFPCTTADHVTLTVTSGQTISLTSKYGLFGVAEHGP